MSIISVISSRGRRNTRLKFLWPSKWRGRTQQIEQSDGAKRAPPSIFLVSNLVGVNEGKAGDEVIVAIECRGDEVLGVVTDELEEGEHGKTSMLELGRLALGEDICRQLQNAGGGREPTVGLDATDEGEDLDPS